MRFRKRLFLPLTEKKKFITGGAPRHYSLMRIMTGSYETGFSRK
jgi:hypothetical protein